MRSGPISDIPQQQEFWRRDRIAGIALIVLGAVIAWEGRRLPMGTWHNPGAGYLPMLLAALLALFGVAIAAMDRASPPVRRLDWPEAPHALLIVLACGAAAFLLERIGYRLTIFALVLFFLALIERRTIVMSLAVAAGLAAGSYALFATLLRVPLPIGPWGW
jgi:putative tricarboxylic transport membrane protein